MFIQLTEEQAIEITMQCLKYFFEEMQNTPNSTEEDHKKCTCGKKDKCCNNSK